MSSIVLLRTGRERLYPDAVGIDTPSIDRGPSKGFAAHVALMTHNIPALENVADLSELPQRGRTISALPMKIK